MRFAMTGFSPSGASFSSFPDQPTPAMSAFATAAPDLSNRGLAVLPLGGNGKQPLIKWREWRKRPGQAFIQKLIDEFPAANIGVLCGLSGITVVDIDAPELTSLMIERFGETPLKTVTPSGGLHLWYRNSGEGCPKVLRGEGLAVDIKGKGGLVVVPPSVRPAGQYAGHLYSFFTGSWDDLPHLPPIRPGALNRATRAAALIHPR